MASVVAGAVIAGLAFTGANYGGQYLDRLVRGDHSGELAAERRRHDLAMEKYENDLAAWNKKRQEYRDWLDENYRAKMQADKNFENTDYAFKLYAAAHPRVASQSYLRTLGNKPQFKNYYTPSERQRNSELVFVVLSGLAIGGAVAYFSRH